MNGLSDLLSGIVVALWSVVALVFLKFWQRARDRLFGFFALAFMLLAVNYLVLALNPTDSEIRPYLYVIRLAAFAVIIFGIIDKNRKTGR